MSRNNIATIYTLNALDFDQYEVIAQAISSHQGVMGVSREEHLPNLIRVFFNPEEIQVFVILSRILRQGFDAILVAHQEINYAQP